MNLNEPPGFVALSNSEEEQPVAYDQYGRPLYARPQQQRTQIVQISRPLNPVETPIAPEVMTRYEDSRKKYPQLNLSKGEYVISAIKRHPIGLIKIWTIAGVLAVAVLVLLGVFFLGPSAQPDIFGTENQAFRAFSIVGLLFVLFMAVVGGLVSTYVYTNNRFYLTNESVIQDIQTSLFSRNEQTVILSNIEDVSYRQAGILQMMLDYGTIRLSTEGDETTYRFSYVAHPKKQIAILNTAVEAFKNGRPVEGPHQDQPS